MTTLGPVQAEHLATGALLAGLGVLASLPRSETRSWWPTAGSLAVVAVTVAGRVAPLVPHRLALAAVSVGVAASVGWLTRDCVSVLRSWRAPSWLVAALLGAAAVGVYAAVPDTEAALRTVGGLGALGVLALLAPLIGPPEGPPSVWIASAVVVVWSAAVGATGRPAAFLGTLACYGVLVALPLAVRLVPRAAAAGARVWWPAVAAVQVPLVLFGGRDAGLRRGAGPALLPALTALAAAVAAFALLLLGSGWWSRRRARPA